MAKENNRNEEAVKKNIYERFNVTSLKDLTVKQASETIERLSAVH